MNRVSMGTALGNMIRAVWKHCDIYHRPLTETEKEELEKYTWDFENRCSWCGGKPKK